MIVTIVFPMALHIGNANIPLHAICETLGIFIGFRYFLYLKKKQGDVIESSNRVWVLIGATTGALIGSRIIGALENPTEWFNSANPFMYAYQQKTIVGGLLGALLVVEFTKILLKEKTATGDLFVFPLILAMIIGRLGCFSMGIYEETYGLQTSLPWGMNLGDNTSRHPVTLYEIVFLLLLWFALWWVQKKSSLANGAVYKLFMMSYLSFRFLLDFIKPHYTFSIGLSSIQLTSVFGLIWYSRYLLMPSLLLNRVRTI
jgi:phosphatidylglycerol:prolipoprotein diacylglycerol transferase